jgi:hypothetical protein
MFIKMAAGHDVQKTDKIWKNEFFTFSASNDF